MIDRSLFSCNFKKKEFSSSSIDVVAAAFISTFFRDRVRTMLVLTIAALLLMVGHSQGAMTAIAVLYGNNSTMSYGTLTFTQDNANADVHVTGSLSGLNASSAHVCFKGRRRVVL